MSYIKFRYTLSERDLADLPRFNQYVVKKFLSFFKATTITIGLEKLNNEGEPTKDHIHIHFMTEVKIGTIRTALGRFWTEEEDKRTGNQKYSLREELDVKDPNRFWRYAWKQGARQYNVYENLFGLEDFDPVVEMKCAQEEYAMIVDVNRLKKQKQQDKTNTYNKIVKYLEETKPQNLKEVVSQISDFYLKEGMSMNASTIVGYVTNYGIQHKFIDKLKYDEKMLLMVLL